MKKIVKIVFQNNDPIFEQRVLYVFDFINKHPLAKQKIEIISKLKEKDSDLIISYGLNEGDSDLRIPAQQIFFKRKVPDFNHLKPNSYSFNNQILYSVELNEYENQSFIQKNEFQFDIIETIFFHISRYEEWHYQERREDEHERMDAKKQFLVKNRLHKIPVIDQLIYCFLKAIGIEIQKQKTKYRITHDIDFIVRNNDILNVIKSMGGAILKRQSLQSALIIWQTRFEKNPYDTFDWMLKKEENIEKVIYFLVGGKTKYDQPFDLNLPVFKKAIQICKDRGYTIGIHPSYNTWKDEYLIKKERNKLQQAIGDQIFQTRQHFLRFSFRDTPKIIQELGLEEDSSLGFADRLGFRCGTGFAYHLYDFKNEKAFDFLETPLIFMDSALFAKPKMIRSGYKRFGKILSLSTSSTPKLLLTFTTLAFMMLRSTAFRLEAFMKVCFQRKTLKHEKGIAHLPNQPR